MFSNCDERDVTGSRPLIHVRNHRNPRVAYLPHQPNQGGDDDNAFDDRQDSACTVPTADRKYFWVEFHVHQLVCSMLTMHGVEGPT